MNNGYSICLNKWALDKDIKNELGLLLIISSLCAEKGYCYASNNYLAKIFDITEVSISSKISKLEKKGYISVEYQKRGCEIISREIRLKNILIDDLKIFNSTVKKNFKDNNISINNINNNKYNIYGEFKNVKLTDEEYEKIKNNNLLSYIEKLSSYMASKGKRYKSHYATILNWSRKENKVEKDIPNWFDKELNVEEDNDEELENILKEIGE